jgi:hypothetical protein
MNSVRDVSLILLLLGCVNLGGCGDDEEAAPAGRAPEARNTGDAKDQVAREPMSYIGKALAEAHASKCQNNLRQIGIACIHYFDSVGDHRFYPPNLKSLVDERILPESSEVFACPAKEAAAGAEGWHCSYESLFGLSQKRLGARLRPRTMVAWDNAPRHRGGRCVLYANGAVGWLREAEFQTKLQEAKRALGRME